MKIYYTFYPLNILETSLQKIPTFILFAINLNTIFFIILSFDSYFIQTISNSLTLYFKNLMQINHLVIAITIVFMIVDIGLNIGLRDGLYIESLKFIIEFQKRSNTAVDVIQNLFSLLLNTIFIVAVLAVVFFALYRKLASFILICYFIFNTYLMTVYKACFQQPRPFWYDNNIRIIQWTCPVQFGNPSGHSWLVAIIYQMLFFDLIWVNKYKLKFIFIGSVLILTPVSRMYLGAHSGNQILMGLTNGICMMVLYRYGIQKYFYDFIFQLHLKKKKWHFLILQLVHLIIFLIPLIIFIVTSNGPPLDQTYLMNLNSACPSKKQITTLTLQGGQLVTSTLVQLIFGFITAVAVSSQQNILFLFGKWQFQGQGSCNYILKFVQKLLVHIVVAGIPGVILILIIPMFIQNYIGKYILMTIGVWLAAFLLICYSNFFLVKFKIIKHLMIAKEENPINSNRQPMKQQPSAQQMVKQNLKLN